MDLNIFHLMSYTEILLLILSILFLFYAYFSTKRPKNFPPGPTPYPIVGNIFQLGNEPHKTFMKMSETYGDVFAINFASFKAVILNDYKSIKEAFSENAFSGRPPLKPFLERSGGHPRGVIFTDGTTWVEQRRFALKNLRDFGFGRNTMEGLIQDEINELIDNFKKDVGKPIETQNRFNAAVLNGLWSIITGNRYSHDDAKLNDLIKRLTSGVQRSRSAGAVLFFPLFFELRKRFPFLFGESVTKSKENSRLLRAFMTDTIESHKKTFQDGSFRDFIDVYLAEMEKTKNPNSSFYENEGDHNLVMVMTDLFVAGAETTSTTLTWAFLILSINLDKQQKLQEEIKEVIGMSRLPSLADKPKMPYMEAVIMEVMRFAAMIPLGVFHYTLEDVSFKGYSIPKGTIVVANLYAAMKDPHVWGDPETFRPERFLAKDGKTVIRHEALLPFSTGKRVCLGESLARDELFLFMASLFQRFKVTTDPNEPTPTKIDYHNSTVLIPKAHKIILHDRFNAN